MKKYENLKKVELHCHLEGSLNPVRVSKWIRRDIIEVENTLKLDKRGNLQLIKEKLEYANSLLQTKARLKDAFMHLCKDLQKENVIYAEIRFNPLSHMKRGLTLNEVLESSLEGINSTTLKTGLILCMSREDKLEDNKLVVDIAKKYLNKGIVAVDLIGDELEYPIKNYLDLFTYAKEKEVPLIVHAGLMGTYQDIDVAVACGAKRIGHGIKAIKKFDTMEKLKKYNIPLEICLTSNLENGLYEKFSDHPIQRLIDSGICITINTDNRTLYNTTLTDEYNTLNRIFGMTVKEFNMINKIAIEHSFLTQEEKNELLKEFN